MLLHFIGNTCENVSLLVSLTPHSNSSYLLVIFNKGSQNN